MPANPIPKEYELVPDQWKRSEKNLQNVHPDLVRIFRLALDISRLDPVVTDGARTVEEQKELVEKGASQTMNSRHIVGKDGYAKAIDVAFVFGKEVRWDWPLYKTFADTMKLAAKHLRLQVEWGGDWTALKDGPHFQLPVSKYP